VHTHAVYLKPKGSLASEICSNTLFGAVCWAIQVLGLEDLSKMLPAFNEHPRFVFSSAFPYLCRDDKEKVRFFPKPLIPDLSSEQVNRLAEEEAAKGKRLSLKPAKLKVLEKAKRVKKADFVSEALFREMVLGQTNTEELCRRLVKTTGLRDRDVEQVGRALITTAERRRIEPQRRLDPFASEADVQRNQIDRVAGATVEGLLFHERQTFLRRNAGLWFILRAEELDFLRPAFRYLEDTGIGGRRTTGKGHFGITLDEGTLELPDAGAEADSFVVLSRYLPREGDWELSAEPLSYNLINWRGKHESKFPTPERPPIYKELVRVFAEGSFFPLKDRLEVYGQVVPVGRVGERTVWHNGMAIPVFAKMGGGG